MYFCTKCPNLSVLRINNIRMVVELLKALTVHCRHLRVFDMNLCYCENRFIHMFLLHNCNCRLDNQRYTMSKITYRILLLCKASTLTSINFCPTGAEVVFREIASNEPLPLVYLCISHCLVGAEVQLFLLRCPQLKRLAIAYCDFDVYPLINTVCLHLQQLALVSMKLSMSVPLEALPKLRILSIVEQTLTLNQLAGFLEKCLSLTSLCLEECPLVDDTLGTMLKAFPQLTALNVSYCRLITDECLIALSKYCPKLCELHLKYCKHVTDEGLTSILMNGKMLYLDIYECKEVTIHTVRCIADYCRKIEYFFYGGTKIPENKVSAMLANCKRVLVMKESGKGLDRSFYEAKESRNFWEMYNVCD